MDGYVAEKVLLERLNQRAVKAAKEKTMRIELAKDELTRLSDYIVSILSLKFASDSVKVCQEEYETAERKAGTTLLDLYHNRYDIEFSLDFTTFPSQAEMDDAQKLLAGIKQHREEQRAAKLAAMKTA
jgi:hypothetical protein